LTTLNFTIFSNTLPPETQRKTKGILTALFFQFKSNLTAFLYFFSLTKWSNTMSFSKEIGFKVLAWSLKMLCAGNECPFKWTRPF